MKRTGFLAVMGRPNVGKSTLVNRMVGQKVAIVSPKPQTTRGRILGIRTEGEDQYVFIDTPGIFAGQNPLGQYMVRTARSAVNDCDGAILVIRSGAVSYKWVQRVKQQVEKSGCRILGAVINMVNVSKSSYYNSYYYGGY